MSQYLVYLPSLDAWQKSEWLGELWPTVVSALPAVSEKKQHNITSAVNVFCITNLCLFVFCSTTLYRQIQTQWEVRRTPTQIYRSYNLGYIVLPCSGRRPWRHQSGPSLTACHRLWVSGPACLLRTQWSNRQGEKKHSVLRQQPLEPGQKWHYAVHMMQMSCVRVCVCACACAYHPWIPALL